MSSENKPNVYVSERFQNPETLVAPRKRERWGWAVALAVLSVVAFLTLIVLQWIESNALGVA